LKVNAHLAKSSCENMQLYLASSNPGKLAEFKAMAGPYPALRLGLLPDFSSLPAFDENAPTFSENAAGKALHYSQFTDARILADDSGLVIPALGGIPGVRSARYAGPDATDRERYEKLLVAMRGLTGQKRDARFVCAIAVAQKTRPLAVITARVDGQILESPRGRHGFGYDPVFEIIALQKTFAELSADHKNEIGHRGKAFRRLLEIFEPLL
jgi:XTP/dITP diphosphohydrolase